MTSTEFVYTTYIKTTAEKIWTAITNPEFARQYWGGHENISDWKKGSKWQHIANDEKRTVRMVGEILESTPPKHLVISWVNPANQADKSEYSRVTFQIEPVNDMVRLVVTHNNLKAGSKMASGISMGWPLVLSSMKSFLETGKAIDVVNVKAALKQSCGSEEAA